MNGDLVIAKIKKIY